MASQRLIFLITFIFLKKVLSSFGFTGFDSEGKDGITEKNPYGSHCPVYDIGEGTRFMPFRHGSKLAFYPLTEYDTILQLNIYIPGNLFKATITSTTLKLEKCRPSGSHCNIEEETDSGGGLPYVNPYDWNEVSVEVNKYTNKISIKVDELEVMSKAIFDIVNSVKRGASWAATLPNTISSKTSSMPVVYQVQFKCPELDSRNLPSTTNADTSRTTPQHRRITIRGPHLSTPAHHVEHTTEKPPMRRSDLVGLVVGVAIGALILIGLTVCVYKMFKKRQSMDVTEKSNLKKDKISDKTGVQNQAMQE